MRTIAIQLSASSCEKALEELKQYQKEVEPKLKEVCRRIAEIGAQEARAHLVLANGNTDAAISDPIPTENGYKVVMSGSDVYFVEFGTGNDVNAYTANTTVLVAPGSWSETHAKRYMNYGFWYYNKVRYEGTPAYMPMYYAGRKMREEAHRIVKEVFGR